MKNYIQILVEGDADAVFLQSLIQHHFKIAIERKKEDKKKSKNVALHYNSEKLDIHIMPVGGCSAIQSNKTEILKPYYDDDIESKTLLVFDGDGEKQKTNFKQTLAKLQTDLETLKQDEDENRKPFHYAIYLFPKTNLSTDPITGEDGDLEDLLLKIIQEASYNNYRDCMIQYTDCLVKITGSNLSQNELLEKKSLVYSYIQAYEGGDKAKEIERDYQNHTLWDLDHTAVLPLVEFLKKYIKKI